MGKLEDRIQQKGKFQKNQVEIFKSLLTRKYERVCEVGCGKGFWSYIGAQKGCFAELDDCDIFEDLQVEEIRPYVRRINYENITSNDLPYEDNSFDLVFSMDVIEHVEDDQKFLTEKLRICKPGGSIIIGTPNYYRLTNFLMKCAGQLHYPRTMGFDSYGEVIHLREYSLGQIHNLLSIYTNISKPDYIPCWLGISQLEIGARNFPKSLSRACQFWFVKFNKK
jgi:2-polyprenyl-3-methyl-5-hydroxy-6-metoxy-1,4-benzoquinol methylase